MQGVGVFGIESSLGLVILLCRVVFCGDGSALLDVDSMEVRNERNEGEAGWLGL